MKILFVTSEEAPYAKVGGLGEVMFALPRALRAMGHDVRVMIPYYGTIPRETYRPNMIHEGLMVPTAPDGGGKKLVCNVKMLDHQEDEHSAVPTYFLENEEYFELRANVYGYTDDRTRFALLSRGCLEFLDTASDWVPDLIVSTDWVTGYLPNFLATEYRDRKNLKDIATVFSIHNLSSQGTSPNHKFMSEMERDDGHGPIPDFFSPRMEKINAMRRGIMYANVINTVSQTYADEITHEEFGEMLDGLLKARCERLFGVLNGIDNETNNPEMDELLEKNYTARSLDVREENKIALQKRFGLPQGKDIFVASVISRLTRQKGFSLFEDMIDPLLADLKIQLIVVGTGDTEIMKYFQELEKRYPDQVRAHLQYDRDLPHLMFAGSDVILIPSYFEPCGLVQMEAMRYGAIPVARRVGGWRIVSRIILPRRKKVRVFCLMNLKRTRFWWPWYAPW